MLRGNPAGWADAEPWPRYESQAASILASPAPTQSGFTMRSDVELPAGTPQLMVWNDETSAFEKLSVSTITPSGSNFAVVLSTPHVGATLEAGVRVSPYSARLSSISRGVVAYFDSLGAGEVVADDDVRFAFVYRRPSALVTEPHAVGDRIVTFISQAIGGGVERGSAVYSQADAPVPTFDPSAGTYVLVPGAVAVYPD
jgi:hypothetical protein